REHGGPDDVGGRTVDVHAREDPVGDPERECVDPEGDQKPSEKLHQRRLLQHTCAPGSRKSSASPTARRSPPTSSRSPCSSRSACSTTTAVSPPAAMH